MKRFVLSLFVLIPAIFAVIMLAFPDKEVSELENRSLTTKKDISFNFLDGDFQDSLDGFVSDQFPFRDELVYFQTWLYYSSGQREIKGAYICDDGRLIQLITDSDIDKKRLISYAEKINRLAKDNTVYVMYIPSACVELKNQMPAGRASYNYPSLYKALGDCLSNAEMIDLSDKLTDEKYYYKTDHHWTADGAYIAYKSFCEAKSEHVKDFDSFEAETVSNDFRGTLFSKVPISKQTDEIKIPSVSDVKTIADGQIIDFYCLDALETKDKYNVFQGGNHGTVEITNENGNGKTLLILKDSFANSFVPFIADEYSKIVMLDERYTFLSLEDYVSSLSPDEILVLREIIN